ncbi:MAG: exonuclease subunit alpha [Gemmataceae bacterium]|nr:exonuclease subunit alpha [Gemmataceae bacterium]
MAFSRVQDRLVVVCAQTLLNHIPTEFEDYQSAVLWKALRELCSREVGRADVGGQTVRVMMPPPDVRLP